MAFRKTINIGENSMNMDVETTILQFKLNYLKTEELPMGKTISTLTVAGLKFEILYYRKKWVKEQNFTSLSFGLYCQSEVIVSFGVVFLDNQGRRDSRACHCQRLLCTFSPESLEHSFDYLIENSNLEANFLKDDCFTVVCSITILSDKQKEVPKCFVNGIIPWSIDQDYAKLLESKDMVDVTFEVDGESFTAHRLILSTRSPVFKAELFGGMAESKMKTIEIKGIKPVVFKAMLHFIYTDTLLNMCDEDIPFDTLIRHLLEAADRYALDGLKMLCEERLTRDISMDSVISSLALAEDHGCFMLKDDCIDFAAKTENFVQLALKPEYVQLMQQYPSLLEDVGDRARKNDAFKNLISKKRRTS